MLILCWLGAVPGHVVEKSWCIMTGYFFIVMDGIVNVQTGSFHPNEVVLTATKHSQQELWKLS